MRSAGPCCDCHGYPSRTSIGVADGRGTFRLIRTSRSRVRSGCPAFGAGRLHRSVCRRRMSPRRDFRARLTHCPSTRPVWPRVCGVRSLRPHVDTVAAVKCRAEYVTTELVSFVERVDYEFGRIILTIVWTKTDCDRALITTAQQIQLSGVGCWLISAIRSWSGRAGRDERATRSFADHCAGFMRRQPLRPVSP